MISKIKDFFSSLDLRLYLFSTNKPLMGCNDKVYIKENIKGINSYSLLTIKGTCWSKEETDYHLVDENNRDVYVNVDKVYPYKGQDLKKQKIYDVVSTAILFSALIAVAIVLSVNYHSLMDNRLYKHL